MSWFADIPWPQLAIAFALCLAISALGFRRVDWFISLGYGFSIAAQAVLFGLLYAGSLGGWVFIQAALLFAYGMRLALFLVARERSASFGRELEASKARSAGITGGLKLVIWISVAALYVAMFSPALLSMSRQSQGATLPTVPAGVVVMAIGLLLEAGADWQKSHLKARNPAGFVRTGLFRLVRYPNYFGEMLFWFGVWVSGMAAYQSVLSWVLATVGFVCIELVMVGSARRLELKQGERYGSDPAYQQYVRSVPVLLPLLPIYSVRNARIYLG